MSPPLRSDPLGLVVTIRPEHRLNEHEVITALAAGYAGCVIGTMTLDPSRAECEAAIRHVLWESGNGYLERLAAQPDAEARMAWARELYARHFTDLFPRKDPT